MSHDKKLDIRAKRSRQWMYSALMELMLEKPYAKITVTDITERAGIARPTFYLHFEDKNALLVYSIDLFFAELTSEFERKFNVEPEFSDHYIIQIVFQQVYNNPDLFNVILNGEAGSLMLKRFHHYITHILNHIIELFKSDQTSDVPVSMLADYLSGASVMMISGWLNRGMPYSPETMAKLFFKLVSPGLQDILVDHGLDNLLKAEPKQDDN
jgi:AcrR family transcriptional regulator